MTTSIELKDDLPSITPEQAANLMKNYKAICAALLDESDYSTIQGKKHKNKSAWRKLGRAFYISDKILEKTLEGSTWYVTVEASTPNGRTAIGIAACSASERKFAHPEHDTLAIAHTRAKNRAISDLIGVGEVSAEEMTSDPDTLELEKVFAGRMDGKKI